MTSNFRRNRKICGTWKQQRSVDQDYRECQTVMWCVYIVECNDKGKTLYTGMTNDLDARIKTHNAGKGARYTKGRTPVTLLKSFDCESKSDALKLEYHIKQLPRDEKLNYAQKI
jgi:putative endonuclease